MAQHLRVLTGVIEDTDSKSVAHTETHNHMVTPVLRGLIPSSDFHMLLHAYGACARTHTHTPKYTQ